MMMTSSMIFNFIIIVAVGALLGSVVQFIVGMMLLNLNKFSLFTTYTVATLAGYFSLFCWGWYQSDNLWSILIAFGNFMVRITT